MRFRYRALLREFAGPHCSGSCTVLYFKLWVRRLSALQVLTARAMPSEALDMFPFFSRVLDLDQAKGILERLHRASQQLADTALALTIGDVSSAREQPVPGFPCRLFFRAQLVLSLQVDDATKALKLPWL